MAITGPYHHVHLVSPDPDAAAEWYEKLLGGEISQRQELRGARNVRVRLGEALLNIRGPRPTDKLAEPGEARPYGIHHFCFAVDDIEDMLLRLEENGGVVTEPLFTLPSGNRAAFVECPDRVLIELIQPKEI